MMSELTPQTAMSSFRPQALRTPLVVSATSSNADQTAHLATRRLQADTGLQRVAALLISISRNNSYEGRNPEIIPDSVTSGIVAEMLGSSVSDLAHFLIQLQQSGLIAQAQGGALRLLDRPALERLIDAH